MKAPFRADQVGSLLRPDALRDARVKFKRGEIDAAALKAAEDAAIRDAVARQEAIGLQSITDGELRRDWWHLDYMGGFAGVQMITNDGPKFKASEEQPPIPSVTGKVRYVAAEMVDHFAFLKGATRRTAKMTIPSPSMLHLRGGRKSISTQAYPDIDEFWADVSAAYRQSIKAFAEAGCTYCSSTTSASPTCATTRCARPAAPNGGRPRHAAADLRARITRRCATGRPA